jgi:hypothetical protein
MFTRFFTLAAIGTAASFAAASDVIGIRVNLGYHWSQNFKLRDGGKGNLEGPEVGVDFPIQNLAGIQLYASPSIVFGGKLVHGSDIDGQIYRFMVSARKTLNRDGFFGSLSLGAAHTESRGLNEFKSADGFIGAVGLGSPLKFKILGVSPNFEGRYYFSSKDQLRGFTIGLSASF